MQFLNGVLLLGDQGKILTLINRLSASVVHDLPCNYLFFLNSGGRYVADVFLLKLPEGLAVVSLPSVLENFFHHLAGFDLRKIVTVGSSFNVAISDQISDYADPRGLGFLHLDQAGFDDQYINRKIDSEIAEFLDFEFERSIILEFGKISSFISQNKGCYPGQELMHRTFSSGVVRKTVAKIKKTDIESYSVLKKLSENDIFILCWIKIE